VDRIFKVKSSANGLNNLCPRFIKPLLPYVLNHITHILNTVFTTSFPIMWAKAKILPLLKPIVKCRKSFRDVNSLSNKRLFWKKISHIWPINSSDLGKEKFHDCYTNCWRYIRVQPIDSKVKFLTLIDQSKSFDVASHLILCTKLSNLYNFLRRIIPRTSAFFSVFKWPPKCFV